MNITAEQRAELLKLVRIVLRTLDEDARDSSVLRGEVAAIEAEVEGGTRTSLGARIFRAIAVAGATEVGRLTLDHLAQMAGIVN